MSSSPANMRLTLPEYLRKAHYGRKVQNQFDELNSQARQTAESHDQLKEKLSGLGILGQRPSLFVDDEKYIQSLVEIFRKRNETQEDTIPQDDITDTPIEKSICEQLKSGLNRELVNFTNPFPTMWLQPIGNQVDMSEDGLELATLLDQTPSRVKPWITKADQPIPIECGVFYYEVEVLTELDIADISIGIALDSDKILADLPGMERDTFGYHGKSGRFISRGEMHYSRMTYTHEEKFGCGDIVGCGVNLFEENIFFTKNGVLFDNAFWQICKSDFERNPVPIIGMSDYNRIKTNFGFTREPFVFDITNYVLNCKDEVRHSVAAKNGQDMRPVANQLIARYFQQMGMAKAFSGFNKDLRKNAVDGSMERRSLLKRLLYKNDIDGALECLRRHFPDILKNENLTFELHCIKLTNMIAEMNENEDKIDQILDMSKELKAQFDGDSFADRLNEIISMMSIKDSALKMTFAHKFHMWNCLNREIIRIYEPKGKYDISLLTVLEKTENSVSLMNEKADVLLKNYEYASINVEDDYLM